MYYVWELLTFGHHIVFLCVCVQPRACLRWMWAAGGRRPDPPTRVRRGPSGGVVDRMWGRAHPVRNFGAVLYVRLREADGDQTRGDTRQGVYRV